MEQFWYFLSLNTAFAIAAAVAAFAAARIRLSAPRWLRILLDVLFLLPLALPQPMLAVHPISLYLPVRSELLLYGAADAFSALPLFYLCAVMGFRRVDRETADAARLQGLGRCGTFWRVWFPPARPWLVLGLGLGLIRSVLLTAALQG